MPIETANDFSQAVLEEAKQEAEKMLDLARREAERILDGARTELDQIYATDSQQSKKQHAQTQSNQTLSTAELEARRQVLLTQERLITEVQQRVKDHLRHLRDNARYSEILTSLIARGLAELEGENFEVIVAPEDRPLVTTAMLADLHRQTDKAVNLSQQSQDGMTGAIIQRADQRVRCDNSFEAILHREQQDIRLLIAQELLEEHEEKS